MQEERKRKLAEEAARMEAQLELEKRKRAQMMLEEEQRRAEEARMREQQRQEALRRREEERKREEEDERIQLEMLKAKRKAELDVCISFSGHIDTLF